MPIDHWFLLVLVCAFGAMSPGPSLLCVLQHTIRAGRVHGLCVALAHAVGVGLWALLTIAGISKLIESNAVIEAIAVFTGGAYLLYLGYHSLSSGLKNRGNSVAELGESKETPKVVDGFLIAFLNPKLALFFTAIFSQFVEKDMSVYTSSIMVTTAFIIDALWYVVVVLCVTVGDLRSLILKHLHHVDVMGGLVFCIVGGQMLIMRLI